METLKKIGTILVGGLFLTATLAGCATNYSQEEVNNLVDDAKAEVQKDVDAAKAELAVAVQKAATEADDKARAEALVNITALKEEVEKLQKQADKDALVLEDYEAAQAEVDAELEEVEGRAYFNLNNDLLEIGEPLGEVTNSFTVRDLPNILQGGMITTDEGTTAFTQYLYFEDNLDPIYGGVVVYTEDEFDEVGPRLYIPDGEAVFEWRLEFAEGLETEIDDGDLEDYDGKKINFLGRDYYFINSEIDTTTSKVTLNLLGGEVIDTLKTDETRTYTIDGKDYEVTLLFVSDPNSGGALEAKLSVNGEVTDALEEGDTDKLSDGLRVGVEEILVSNGKAVVEFFLGANQITFQDHYNDNDFETGVEVDDENIEDGLVSIRGSVFGDEFEITSIRYRLLADAKEGDIYIAPGHALSEYLDEPEGLFGVLDLVFEGLDDTGFDEIRFDPQGDDGYSIEFTNNRDQYYDVEFLTTDDDAFGGDFRLGNDDEIFHVAESDAPGEYPIAEDDYFLVTDDADETGVSNIYKFDSIDVDNREITFRDLSDSGDEYETTYELVSPGLGEGTLIAGGNSYPFWVNETSEMIEVDQNRDGTLDGAAIPLVVKGGGILDLGDENGVDIPEPYVFTLTTLESEFDDGIGGDEVITFEISDEDGGTEVEIDVTNGVNLESVDDTDDEVGMSAYGIFFKLVDESNDPDKLIIEYPHRQRGAIAYLVAREE